MSFVWIFCLAVLGSQTMVQAHHHSLPDDYTDGDVPDEGHSNAKCIKQVSNLQEEFQNYKNQMEANITALRDENKHLRGQIEEFQLNELALGPGDKADTSNIWDAAERGSMQAVVYYIKEDPNNINKRNESFHSYTPLMYASRKGHPNIVRFLISKGADIDAINSDGNTALLISSFWGHTKVVEVLVNKGANLNVQNLDRGSALHAAVATNHLEVVKLLVQNGANVNLKNEIGRTPLELAIKRGHTSIVEFLSQH